MRLARLPTSNPAAVKIAYTARSQESVPEASVRIRSESQTLFFGGFTSCLPARVHLPIPFVSAAAMDFLWAKKARYCCCQRITMYSADQCRAKALKCAQYAKIAREPERSALMEAAARWLFLADQAAKLQAIESDEAAEPSVAS